MPLDDDRGPGLEVLCDSDRISPLGWDAAVREVVRQFELAAGTAKDLLEQRTRIGVALLAINKTCNISEWRAFKRRVLAHQINQHTFYTAIRLASQPFVDGKTGEVDHEAMTEMLRARGFRRELCGTLIGAEILANVRKAKKKHLATDDEIRELERTQAEEAVDSDDPNDYVLEDGELDGMAALNFAADQDGDEDHDDTNIPAHRGGGGDGAADADRLGDRRAGDHAPAVTGAAGGARANPSPAADERTGCVDACVQPPRAVEGGTAPGAGGSGPGTGPQLSLEALYVAAHRVREVLTFNDLGTLTEHQRELLLELADSLTQAEAAAT